MILISNMLCQKKCGHLGGVRRKNVDIWEGSEEKRDIWEGSEEKMWTFGRGQKKKCGHLGGDRRKNVDIWEGTELVLVPFIILMPHLQHSSRSWYSKK